MGWLIRCIDPQCGKETWASNIVDLIKCIKWGSGGIWCQALTFDTVDKGDVTRTS